MMRALGKLLAWPIKALAWLLIAIAFLLSARWPDDTLGAWLRREFYL